MKSCRIIGIACIGKDRSIGYKNNLIWRSKKDLSFVKSQTVGKAILMGRKTFESLPNRKPLPNRINIVLTKNPERYENIKGLLYFIKSPEEANDICYNFCIQTLFVFGGSEIYSLMSENGMMKELYLTVVDSISDKCDSYLDLDFTKWSDRTLIDQWKENDLNHQLILMKKIIKK